MQPATATATATRQWTTATGKHVTASITLVLAKDIDADGDRVIVDCCELGDVRAEVTGHPAQYGYETLRVPRNVNGVQAVASIGKLALDAGQAELVEAMIREVKAHPAYIAKLAQIDRNQREIAEMDARRARNGLCPRCGTYCRGDCEA